MDMLPVLRYHRNEKNDPLIMVLWLKKKEMLQYLSIFVLKRD